jgi:hypothetical protein
MVLPAEFPIKGRGRFYPFYLQIKFDKTMVDKEVASNEVDELPCGEMIPHGCKTDTGRDSRGPAQGAKQGGFGHTETPFPPEHKAGPVVLGQVKGGIGIITNTVSHSEIEFHRFIDRVFAFSDNVARIIPNASVVAVNDGSGYQIEKVLLVHSSCRHRGVFLPP